MLLNINYLQYQHLLKIKRTEKGSHIHCLIRQKYLVLQPEEIVRQLTLLYLIEEKKYNRNRIRAEKLLHVNDLRKRCDILVYDTEVNPLLLVECKAARVKITQATFKQIAWYNMPLKVKYLVVTNGLQTYCCEMDYDKHTYQFLPEIPVF